MELTEIGLSAEQVHRDLVLELGRDPDLLGMLEDPRVERLVEALCRAIGDVVERNNEAIRQRLSRALIAVDSRARQI